MSKPASNTAELPSSYVDPLDMDFTTAPFSTPVKTASTKGSPIIVQKKPKTRKRFYIVGGLIALCIISIILYFTLSQSSSLISKYENKSSFSNKDQYEDPNTNDYDIHYLVEQMIYKEFTPKDKKKYLNLPQTLKEQLMYDYLIEKI